jgi:hypothetical protein
MMTRFVRVDSGGASRKKMLGIADGTAEVIATIERLE